MNATASAFPLMLAVRQNFPKSAPLDIRATLRAEFAQIAGRIQPGARIAVAVGSRGITNLQPIVASVVENLKAAGAQPFVIPAMGSHGGATPEGQRDILSYYDITEASVGAPIWPSVEVEQIGVTEDGVPVFCSVEAMRADGVVIVNRIKPHTDFSGTLGSGVMKMLVIGLGKRTGATAMHAAASRLGHERVIRSLARAVLRSAPILCGVAILENQFHDTAKLSVLPREEIEKREEALLIEARNLMPRLPLDEIDLLIVDRIGKNISGAGMDPNVIGRWVQGYSSALKHEGQSPFIRRILVRDLTPETHGNAIGIGLADLTTTRVANAVDKPVTYINALTSLTPHCAKIPIHFDTDRECVAQALVSLAMDDPRTARVVRIADTLSLAEMEVSESCAALLHGRADLSIAATAAEMRFDGAGNLLPIRVA